MKNFSCDNPRAKHEGRQEEEKTPKSTEVVVGKNKSKHTDCKRLHPLPWSWGEVLCFFALHCTNPRHKERSDMNEKADGCTMVMNMYRHEGTKQLTL